MLKTAKDFLEEEVIDAYFSVVECNTEDLIRAMEKYRSYIYVPEIKQSKKPSLFDNHFKRAMDKI
ncbi:MAG: hypothetical protein PHG18_03730 [Bacilli bacterium]|nr:hypothetical protein [Bacilli bacterium]